VTLSEMKMKITVLVLLGLSVGAMLGCTTMTPTETTVQRRHGVAYLNYWGPPYLLIRVPDGYRISPRKGPDFDVYRFSRIMADTNTPPPATMGLYIGDHPQRFEATHEVSDVPFVLLGSNRTWRCYSVSTPKGFTYVRESYLAKVFPTSQEAGLIVHVWINGADTNEIAVLSRMVESIHVKN